MGGKALVIGARRRIRKAIAMTLAAQGFDIAVNDLARSAELDETVAEVTRLGRNAVAVPGDVGDISGHSRMLDQAESALGPLTTLVNNAGVSVMSRGDLLE